MKTCQICEKLLPSWPAVRETPACIELLTRLSRELRISGTNGSDDSMSAAEIQRATIEMFAKNAALSDWAKTCLYKAGHREVAGRLEDMTNESLIRQLEASKELRERVRLCLIEADQVEIPRPVYYYKIAGTGNE